MDVVVSVFFVKCKLRSGATWMDLAACFTTRSSLFMFSAESELW